ncbi:hypothetical protein HHI36_016117 [Cryptolaemus montrouzieri]|uniref:Peptidase S1 domain-containing protein n=1 Tax=Cryptolaemus montrouzieri TaxID=559131 RepID=A0ABD2NIS2_9CUCU
MFYHLIVVALCAKSVWLRVPLVGNTLEAQIPEENTRSLFTLLEQSDLSTPSGQSDEFREWPSTITPTHETSEGSIIDEVETISPAIYVLNPNSTNAQFQLKPNRDFIDWILGIFNGGNPSLPIQGGGTVINEKPPAYCAPCTCGILNEKRRIVGGVVTKVNQYPWMVALKFNNRFFCGGSLINSRYVLTAGHCTIGIAKERLVAVFLEHDRSDTSETQTFTKKVIGIYRHRSYNSGGSYNNDIALLKLENDVPAEGNMRPVCLPDVGKSYSGLIGTVTGWGATAEYGQTSQKLREVSVPILSNDDCRKTKYGNKITANMMCAGTEMGGKDACQGDSGGPLHVANGTQNMVVGIVSWGEGCAEKDYPGVYTRVNRYITWIKTNTRDACYC